MPARRRSLLAAAAFLTAAPVAARVPQGWQTEWPRTDFSRATVDLAEIRSGGPPRDGIPSIDSPSFLPVRAITDLDAQEPVLSLVVNGDARAYPLRVLIWHEIVNDVVGEVPVAVTYCPLCNTAIVFDRRLDGMLLDFGTTGKLRHSDLVMYDRQTESWWQQYGGAAIVGRLAGRRLAILPARLESLERFRDRAPQGRVLVPPSPALRPYGTNPYAGYDSAPRPFLFGGEEPPEGVPPMMYVVAVGKTGWTLPLLRRAGEVRDGDLLIRWIPGKRSALDTRAIARGRELGNVVVQRGNEDVHHVVTFAFAFFAFEPDGVLHTEDGPVRRP
ncbi:DUF3179 domain-containing protein [Elioraea sp.]|uniref:DUF3179 domain-containing protein n=1 Tax=Elioraea sp. TaxID=2185103 RepID=UPI003F71336E